MTTIFSSLSIEKLFQRSASQTRPLSGSQGVEASSPIERLAGAIEAIVHALAELKAYDRIEGSAPVPAFARPPWSDDGSLPQHAARSPRAAAAEPARSVGANGSPTLHGHEALATTARLLYDDEWVRKSLGRAAPYLSINPEIVGTYRGHPKCNVFAGDVLFGAGFEAPTYRMAGGGAHYVEAERWPAERAHFDKLRGLADVRPGDLLVVDWKGREGRGGAHLEVITGHGRGPDGRSSVTTIGARRGGLEQDRTYGDLLARARPQGDRFETAEATIYILRPKKLRG